MQVKSIILSAIVGLSLSGCFGNKPEPLSLNIQANSNIDTDTKQKLLNVVIDEHRNGYSASHGCLTTHSSLVTKYGDNYQGNYKNCFIYQDNSIIRNDHSRCTDKRKKDRCLYIIGSSSDYGIYINKLQKNLLSYYNNEVSKYENFLAKYDTLNDSAEKKVSQLELSLTDSTKLLNKNIFTEYNKITPKLKVDDKFRMYKKYKNNITASNFTVKISTAGQKKDRYSVVYDKSSIETSFDKLPEKINFKINKVYFSFLPTTYIMEDKNLKVGVSNYPLATTSKSIKSFTFTNKTTDYIEIDTISGYYNGDVINEVISLELIKRKIKMAPESTITLSKQGQSELAFKNFPSNKLIELKSKKQKVKYGFSIRYTLENKNISKNLYVVKTFTPKSFD